MKSCLALVGGTFIVVAGFSMGFSGIFYRDLSRGRVLDSLGFGAIFALVALMSCLVNTPVRRSG